MRKRYTLHIDTSGGPRFSYHDSEDDIRRELIDYWNEVHAGDDDVLLEDATLNEACDKVEEVENVSIDEVWDDNSIRLAPAERDTILAALRFWQKRANDYEPEWDIACGGRPEPLGCDEIDALCERINT